MELKAVPTVMTDMQVQLAFATMRHRHPILIIPVPDAVEQKHMQFIYTLKLSIVLSEAQKTEILPLPVS